MSKNLVCAGNDSVCNIPKSESCLFWHAIYPNQSRHPGLVVRYARNIPNRHNLNLLQILVDIAYIYVQAVLSSAPSLIIFGSFFFVTCIHVCTSINVFVSSQFLFSNHQNLSSLLIHSFLCTLIGSFDKFRFEVFLSIIVLWFYPHQ